MSKLLQLIIGHAGYLLYLSEAQRAWIFLKWVEGCKLMEQVGSCTKSFTGVCESPISAWWSSRMSLSICWSLSRKSWTSWGSNGHLIVAWLIRESLAWAAQGEWVKLALSPRGHFISKRLWLHFSFGCCYSCQAQGVHCCLSIWVGAMGGAVDPFHLYQCVEGEAYFDSWWLLLFGFVQGCFVFQQSFLDGLACCD